MQDCFKLYHTVQDYVAAYIWRHVANKHNLDAETNWLTNHNHCSAFVDFEVKFD